MLSTLEPLSAPWETPSPHRAPPWEPTYQPRVLPPETLSEKPLLLGDTKDSRSKIFFDNETLNYHEPPHIPLSPLQRITSGESKKRVSLSDAKRSRRFVAASNVLLAGEPCVQLAPITFERVSHMPDGTMWITPHGSDPPIVLAFIRYANEQLSLTTLLLTGKDIWRTNII
ncbi:hypothetical protein RIF29_24573 [Crotalaria pallida]|uniref:Uncharacterized protein n=1 Tax=Crotalaria pallida TaxID=3830 RepID=A0AAN9EM99_CROPI